MKFLIGFICLLVVMIGAVYGLARAHILPLQGLAKSSPAAQKLLLAMKLIPPAIKQKAAASTAQTPPDPLAAQKKELAAEQLSVAQEKAQLDQKAAAAAAAPAAVVPPAVTQTAPKLVEIYESMDSDDLATLFAKQPDSAVVSALIAMDTKKAAKALAALPPDRAAKITALMNQAMAMAPSTPQS